MLEMLETAPKRPDDYTLRAEGVVGEIAVVSSPIAIRFESVLTVCFQLVATDTLQYIRLDCTAGITNNIFYNLRLTGFERSAADVMKDVWTKKTSLGDIKISRTADWVRAG
jgi:hypothetical protein